MSTIREQLIDKIGQLDSQELVELFSIDVEELIEQEVLKLSDEKLLEKLL